MRLEATSRHHYSKRPSRTCVIGWRRWRRGTRAATSQELEHAAEGQVSAQGWLAFAQSWQAFVQGWRATSGSNHVLQSLGKSRNADTYCRIPLRTDIDVSLNPGSLTLRASLLRSSYMGIGVTIDNPWTLGKTHVLQAYNAAIREAVASSGTNKGVKEKGAYDAEIDDELAREGRRKQNEREQ